ncbi:allophanate hydrolase [Streptomyces sp. 3MP-14]|uniref:Allophanate hydrolase n=1 Tax=Streptomyces mimosae TaxID=2586635 RepID=A0A5N6AID2_9ACTN|nr:MULTISPECIES: allophanate hydrolase [Streptomyces]KAB8167995.1 allophanate hydrolase [Streptomyces mimosae]KAB8177711.1 allophanate hydrolase [Streptomyces sp. 3MP-14]
MTAVERTRRALALLAERARPEAWIAVRPEAELLAEAAALDARVAAGAALPLAGLVCAVKDNIDVAGLPTTAGCPGYAYAPGRDAPAVARLRAAGALVVGKTALDQFATGLVGTRSPHGPVRSAGDPERVSGGSSSGSAVAVALGVVDFALGTDTAGSGRVPAAFQGIVGVKPTLGLVPTEGVVPAARSFDCLTVFAPTLGLAGEVAGVMAEGRPGVGGRGWPADAPLAAPPRPTVAVPAEGALRVLAPGWRAAFDAAVGRLAAAGARIETIDLGPFLRAAELLYGGAFAAERYAAVGAFLDDPATGGAPGVDPTVRSIITAAGRLSAHAYAADLARLAELRHEAMAQLDGCDVLLLPTAPEHPTLAEVAADPVGVNSRLGTFTNFVNLLDLSAVAVPAGEVDGGPFGVTVIARGFADRVAADVAAALTGEELSAERPALGAPGLPLVVFGAHLSGQPLNGQLTSAGARLAGAVRTAPEYRMVALPGEPARPGVLRVAAGEPGQALEGELWSLPPAALGRLLAGLPAPLALGRVRLGDGREVTGFLCEAAAAAGAPDISHHGGWRAYRAASAG